jgi:hypothetical protein
VSWLGDAAEQLAGEWAAHRDTVPEPAERDLARHIVRALADPLSDHSEVLDEICRARWTAPSPLRLVREVPS